MNKKTLSNIVFLLMVNIIVKPFWLFGIDRVVQNRLGEETFGLYFALFNFSMLYQILLDFGIQNYNSKEIAENPQNIKTYLPNFLFSKLVLSIVYLVFVFISFVALGYSIKDYGFLFLLLATNQILISFIFYLRSNLTGLMKFKLDALFSILDKLIMIVLASSMLYFNVFGLKLTITNFVLIQTTAFALNFLILILVVISFAKPFHVELNLALIKKLINNSIPFALSIFLMAIYLRMDAIMIERLLGENGAYEAGIYAQSFRIIDSINMLGILFATVLLPTYANRIKNKLPVKSLIFQATGMMLLISLPLALFLILKSNWIINGLYINGSNYSASILAILSVSFIAYSTMHIYSSFLTALSKLKQLNWVFLFGIMLNLVSNLVLIPKHGAKGAAITTTCSEIIILSVIICIAIKAMNSQKPLE